MRWYISEKSYCRWNGMFGLPEGVVVMSQQRYVLTHKRVKIEFVLWSRKNLVERGDAKCCWCAGGIGCCREFAADPYWRGLIAIRRKSHFITQIPQSIMNWLKIAHIGCQLSQQCSHFTGISFELVNNSHGISGNSHFHFIRDICPKCTHLLLFNTHHITQNTNTLENYYYYQQHTIYQSFVYKKKIEQLAHNSFTAPLIPTGEPTRIPTELLIAHALDYHSLSRSPYTTQAFNVWCIALHTTNTNNNHTTTAEIS